MIKLILAINIFATISQNTYNDIDTQINNNIDSNVTYCWYNNDGYLYYSVSNTIYRTLDDITSDSIYTTQEPGAAGFRSIYTDRNNYIYLSSVNLNPSQHTYRSTDGLIFDSIPGFKLPANSAIWNWAEDTNNYIYAAEYGNNHDVLYRSVDSGVSFDTLYDGNHTHIHNVGVDSLTNYIYIIGGDNDDIHSEISTDGGVTFDPLFVNSDGFKQSVGMLIDSEFKLFSADAPYLVGEGNQSIYRTVDNVTFTTPMYITSCFSSYWIRKNPNTGNIYIGWQSEGTCNISRGELWISRDNGITWSLIETIEGTCGMTCQTGYIHGSNFYNNRMYVTRRIDNVRLPPLILIDNEINIIKRTSLQ